MPTSAPGPLSLPEASWPAKYDLYSSTLPFLIKEYLPPPTSTSSNPVDRPAVHSKILTFLRKNSKSGRFRIPSSAEEGWLRIPSIAHPLSSAPLTVQLSGAPSGSVAFGPGESISSAFVGSGGGWEGRLEVDDPECKGHGVLKLRKVWEEAEGEKVLYEGFFALEVVYGKGLRGKGLDAGEQFQGAFWAVRSLVQDPGRDGEY